MSKACEWNLGGKGKNLQKITNARYNSGKISEITSYDSRPLQLQDNEIDRNSLHEFIVLLQSINHHTPNMMIMNKMLVTIFSFFINSCELKLNRTTSLCRCVNFSARTAEVARK